MENVNLISGPIVAISEEDSLERGESPQLCHDQRTTTSQLCHDHSPRTPQGLKEICEYLTSLPVCYTYKK